MKFQTTSSHPLATAALLLLVASLCACGGGDGAAASTPTTPTVDPTVSALSGQLPGDAVDAATLPARLLPPDATAALDASLLPPS